jgi:NAD(P)-dependent dehydrogenase (short-subunit alcohol dehydrogenase family)
MANRANNTNAKVVLITGANKGIGFEVARVLATKGLTVLLAARDRARGEAAIAKLREQKLSARFVELDVTSADSIASAAKWIESEIGRLDILINNAGIAIGGRHPTEADLPDMRRMFEVNLFGAIAVTRAMLPLLERAGKSARIVNVSSGLGSLTLASSGGEYAQYNFLGYPASKSALNMATVQFAKVLRDKGFKVNAADPGYTATDLNGHRGTQTVAEGAESTVRLALLDDDGPTGEFHSRHGKVPW